MPWVTPASFGKLWCIKRARKFGPFKVYDRKTANEIAVKAVREFGITRIDDGDRLIRARDLDMIFITGPGHGGPALVANAYLEGTYSEVQHEPAQARDRARRLGHAVVER